MTNKFRKERYIVQSFRNGKWSFRVRYKDIDRTFNEQDYLSASMCFKEACNYRNEILLRPIIFKPISKYTVQEAYESIGDIYVLRSETKRKLDVFYNKYIHFKDKNLCDVTRADIISDLNAMVNIASTDTIQRVLSIWKKIYGVGIAKGIIEKDLTLQIKSPQSHTLRPTKRNEYIDEETINLLSKALKKQLRFDSEKLQAEYVLQVLYYTGMRPAELFALTKDDINFKNRTININKELGSDRDNRNVIRPCKTNKSHRVIPMPDRLIKTFKDLNTLKSDILFPNYKGEYHNIVNLGQRYHLIAKSIGIDFHFYQCRHSFITNLVYKGVDLKTIQELVGQELDSTTIGYVVSDEDRKKKAINII